MLSSYSPRKVLRDFILVPNNIYKTKNNTKISSSVNYINNFNHYHLCTIYTSNYHGIYNFINNNKLYIPNSIGFSHRFFSTSPESQSDSSFLNTTEKVDETSFVNVEEAYKSEKTNALSELIEELDNDSEIARDKLTIEELFEIDDYHEYLLARITDVNGTKRSIFQKILPVDYIQQLFILVHDYTNLSWSATVCLMTIFFKILLLPVWCISERTRRMNAHLVPKVVELQEKVRNAFVTKNDKLARETQLQIYEITKQNSFVKGVLTQTGATMIQGLMFGTVYGGLKLFAINPRFRPDFTFDSCLWLDSLCLPDPYYILPSIFGILMTLVFEHNISVNYVPPSQVKGSPITKLENKQKYMKLFSRFGILLITFYGFSMPSSAFFYLIPSFLFQTILRYSCNKFNISRLLGIPIPIMKKTKKS